MQAHFISPLKWESWFIYTKYQIYPIEFFTVCHYINIYAGNAILSHSIDCTVLLGSPPLYSSYPLLLVYMQRHRYNVLNARLLALEMSIKGVVINELSVLEIVFPTSPPTDVCRVLKIVVLFFYKIVTFQIKMASQQKKENILSVLECNYYFYKWLC